MKNYVLLAFDKRFVHFDIGVKKKYKMCQLRSENYFMLNFAADFPFVNVSVTRIAFKD